MRPTLAKLLHSCFLMLVLFPAGFGLLPCTQVFGQQSPQAGQKVIKDSAEYNAYIVALNTQDAAQRAAAMETFIAQYPGSVVRIDALEQAMAAYQQAGNQAKVMSFAKRLLELDPGHVRALAIVTALDRAAASQGDAKALAEAGADAEKGLKSLPCGRSLRPCRMRTSRSCASR